MKKSLFGILLGIFVWNMSFILAQDLPCILEEEHGYLYWNQRLQMPEENPREILLEILGEAVQEPGWQKAGMLQREGARLFSKNSPQDFQTFLIRVFNEADLSYLRQFYKSPENENLKKTFHFPTGGKEDLYIAKILEMLSSFYPENRRYNYELRAVFEKALLWDWKLEDQEFNPRDYVSHLVQILTYHLGIEEGYHVRCHIRSRQRITGTDVVALVLEWTLVQVTSTYDLKKDELSQKEEVMEKEGPQVVTLSVSESEKIKGSQYGTQVLLKFINLSQAKSFFKNLKKENKPFKAPEEIHASNWGTLSDLLVLMLPAGEEFSELRVEFKPIAPGTFQMGSPEGEGDDNEHPQHEVTISQGFQLQKTEFTNRMLYQLMGDHPNSEQNKTFLQTVKEKPNHPAVYISWNDAQEVAKALNALNDGFIYRLPYEAEWEYAARAGTKTSYYSEDGDINKIGWHNGNSEGHLHEVGTREANVWGLFDMSGNVWEWCQDGWDEKYYENSPSQDPTGPSQGEYRVVRGGCWGNSAQYLRSASRGYNYWDHFRSDGLGFRLLRTKSH
ncbi:MAG: SUMF1/EgtB/PvdO family nonheme iron enzyme [Deltaproteobacteria bacterium]|nr:SUMF1/EgtB/PvdO family nonheme iron enzyme [Deltaproteobacteria bacterium]